MPKGFGLYNLLILICYVAFLCCLCVVDAADAAGAGKGPGALALTSVSQNEALERDGLEATVSQDKIWIIGGDGEEGVASVKGLTDWKRESKDESLTRLGHSVVSFKDKLWVLGGTDISGFAGDILSSPDGKSWNKSKAPFSLRSDQSAVVFDGKIWVMGGSGEELDAFSDVWSSSDGREWKRVTSEAAFGKRHLHASVVFDDKIWVIGGTLYNESEDSEDVWYSSDGRTWELATSSPGFKSMDGGYQAAVFGGKMWVASLGENGLSFWSSADGKTWNDHRPSEPMDEEVQGLIVYRDELYGVIFGEILKIENISD